MQRVEDLPPPTDPWMIRLYREDPEVARRLDQWCIDVAQACGHIYVRDPVPRYSPVDRNELAIVLKKLERSHEEHWQAILEEHNLLSPAEMRLLDSDFYGRRIVEHPGLRERIHAWVKEHENVKYRNIVLPTGTRAGRRDKKRTGRAG